MTSARRRQGGNCGHVAVALLALALTCARTAAAQSGSEHDALLYRCSENAAVDAVGIEQLEAQCPGLEDALVKSGYAEFISDEQRARLTAHGLVELRDLARRYDEPRPAQQKLDPAALNPILSSLQQEQPPESPLGWFGRLKRWLREALQSAEGSDSWLSRWLEDFEMSPSASNAIYYGVVGSVILLAVIVLVNELRAAGVGRGRRGKRAGSAHLDAQSAHDPRTMTLSELDALPLHEQPSMLLRMIAAQLMQAGRLRAERSLTHRELTRAASFELESDRKSFGRVAGLAEELRYGRDSLVSADIEVVVRDGRALSERLGAGAESAA